MKTKFKKGDVVYSTYESIANRYPNYCWDELDIEFLVVVETFLDSYSDEPRCLLQWDEPDKKTGLPRLTTGWEYLLVKIGEL